MIVLSSFKGKSRSRDAVVVIQEIIQSIEVQQVNTILMIIITKYEEEMRRYGNKEEGNKTKSIQGEEKRKRGSQRK